MGKTLLRAICVALLAGILVAGLWPFHSPGNHVTWLGEENGLRFAYPGTVVSAGEFRLTAPQESSCSIEVWVQPAVSRDSNTLLAFYTPKNPARFALHQSDTDLKLRLEVAQAPPRTKAENLYIGDVFRSGRPVFITISSGTQGTAVYINGALARAARRFLVTANDCTGRLVVATSPVGNDAWTGRLRGLAIYHRDLTLPEVVRHYETWTNEGRPAVSDNEHCAALYLFEERSGDLVHNRIRPGIDLMIPKAFQIQDQMFLTLFWKEFSLSWGYWKDIVENICGFVPLGFFFCAYLSLKLPMRRAALAAVIVGGLVSVTIEVLQAYLPTRQSDTTDIITNTLGTWIGVMVYRQVGLDRVWDVFLAFRSRFRVNRALAGLEAGRGSDPPIDVGPRRSP